MATRNGPVWAYLCGTRLAIPHGHELATNQRAMRIYDALRTVLWDHPIADKTTSIQVEWTYLQIKISIYASGLPSELMTKIRQLALDTIAATE